MVVGGERSNTESEERGFKRATLNMAESYKFDALFWGERESAD